jgi:hypothetical protein
VQAQVTITLFDWKWKWKWSQHNLNLNLNLHSQTKTKPTTTTNNNSKTKACLIVRIVVVPLSTRKHNQDLTDFPFMQLKAIQIESCCECDCCKDDLKGWSNRYEDGHCPQAAGRVLGMVSS